MDKKKINLDENIYVLCFSSRQYIGGLLMELYTNKNKQITMRPKITTKFKKLSKNKWLTKDDTYTPKNIPKNIGKRADKRIYYKATTKPILKKINATMPLKENENEQLNNFLNTKEFRHIIGLNKKIDSIDKIITIISIFALWTYMFYHYLIKSHPTRYKSKKKIAQLIATNISKSGYNQKISTVVKSMKKFIPDFENTITKKIETNMEEICIHMLNLDDILLKKLTTLSENYQIMEYLIGSAFVAGDLMPKSISRR